MSHGKYLSKKQSPTTPNELEGMSKIPYISAIGSIMYAMTTIKNILKYLKWTKDYFLTYGGDYELCVKGYTDASFQTNKDDYRSQSGYVFILNGGVASWKSFKQNTVADSTTEAEYIAAAKAAKEVVWIKNFISKLGVVPSVASPIEIYCDNNGAIAQAKEPTPHQKSKHVERKIHLIRVDREDIKVCQIITDENIADSLTKPMS
ncbi:UNVERIFIED_CONTAM: Retrovirus-related Pol polyprotein from transposon TNT 1-94 [Sesamum latifolium]|uniref:Retrovirus-related Pol polyprotein from transposon TNT 1-94 n=1 Tax=Sesamum latifolium TaxID=2727402 RepID=A0AAW2YC33_9LAMI